MAYSVTQSGFDPRRKALSDLGVIPGHIAPYVDLWWKISCLGSHHTQDERNIKWQSHLEMCRGAAALVLDWYTKRYPPLKFGSNEKIIFDNVLHNAVKISLSEAIIPESIPSNAISNHHSTLFHGPVWMGKTIVSSSMAKLLVDRGYISLPFHERSFLLPTSIFDKEIDTYSLGAVGGLAAYLNRMVPTQLFNGDSFVVFLDDPFGHRRFRGTNPLTRLRIHQWLELASGPESLEKSK